MLIAFTGASGRTDASHAAMLAAYAAAAIDSRATLLTIGDGPAPVTGPDLRVVRLPEASTAEVVARAVEECRRDGAFTAMDMLRSLPGDMRRIAAANLTVVVVGSHEADERAASAWAKADGPPPRMAYLGCRRAGGGPAAKRFAAAMAALDPGGEVVACVLPPLSRGEASALMHAAPAGRALRAGLLLLAAVRRDAEAPCDGGRSPGGRRRGRAAAHLHRRRYALVARQAARPG